MMPPDRRRRLLRSCLVLVAFATAASMAQTTVEVVAVVARPIERLHRLPGELQPFLQVGIHARVNGFVESVEVDRGSVVRKEQLLAQLVAPEMRAQIAEAEAKAQAVQAQLAEVDARIAAAESTHQRLKAAAATPGAVAGNEVIVAEQAVRAARAVRRAVESSAKAAQASAAALRDLESYLSITAPFDGIITERLVHPGALAGPQASATPLFRLEQVSRLRLLVPVPETEVSGIVPGAQIRFTVPDQPGRTFSGVVARIPRSLDARTRTMGVELDVDNAHGLLAPGMYAEVAWMSRRRQTSLLVPPTAIVVTTERVFLVRVRQEKAEWVDVRRGSPAGDLVEVFGPVQPGDLVVRRASDEIREGTKLQVSSAVR